MRVTVRAMVLCGLLAAVAAPGRAAVVEIPNPDYPTCDPNDPTLLLPDLVPDPPTSLRDVVAAGRRTVLFTTAIGNIGDGPLIIEGKTVTNADGQQVTQGWQLIWRKDGSQCAHTTGIFEFHPAHKHFHFDDFVGYELRSGNPETGALATTGEKTSFCLLDIARVRGYPPSQQRQMNQQTCDSQEGTQGISVGWKDVYERILPGQSLNLDPDPQHQVPVGDYFLINRADPDGILWEKSKANNIAFVPYSVSQFPPDLTGLGPTPTPKPRDPHVRPGRDRPTPVPRLPRIPRATSTPRIPTATRTPRGGGVVPTATRTPLGGGSQPTATPTATPTSTPQPGGPPIDGDPCAHACSYGTSQIRMTWYTYNGLLFSMFVRNGGCPALNPAPGETGTVVMNRFLTATRIDTGLEHRATFVMNDTSSADVSNGGTIQFTPGTGGSFFAYNAPVPPLATIANGENFPVVFDMCVAVGDQAVKTRLVCQPHAPGMLCHAG